MAENLQRKNGSAISTTASEQKKKDSQERKRSIFYLILGYLKNCNMYSTCESFIKEAQINNQFTLCDNVDLEIILQEYQSFYNMKYEREPKIIRKISNDTQSPVEKVQSAGTSRTRLRKPSAKIGEGGNPKFVSKDDDFQFEIISIDLQDQSPTAHASRLSQDFQQEKKPLIDFPGYTQEWREIADQIIGEFTPKTLGYTWDHCIGLEEPVELLKEATIYPFLYPLLFQNVTSWNGILMYGSPGTGKTLLAKALACQGNTNFINVTSSTFISKWRGESEKMVKVMFDLAKFYAPTTIFIDEIDALLSETKESNHEASTRFKSELLIQMDGLLSSNNSVFLLATTNFPWKLDKALLRRFEKRILIPLPNDVAKIQMLKHYCNLKNDNKYDLDNVVHLMQNYSGSDIKNVSKEIEMKLVREQIKHMDKYKKFGPKRNTTSEDLISAIKSVRPSINIDYYNKIIQWHNEYGSR